MKVLSYGFFAIVALFLLSSCSGHGGRIGYHAVKHYQPRESTLGFSVTPPPGDNWYESLKNNSLLYLKISKSHRKYSILTEAREVHMDRGFENALQFLAWVKDSKKQAIASEDFRNQQVLVRVEKSLSKQCVRYSLSYEDHGVDGLHGRRHVNVDTEGLFCLHPDNSKVGVEVSYIEKSLSDTVAQSYRNEGEIFLASLNFQKVRKK
jgi:hypothetical protein